MNFRKWCRIIHRHLSFIFSGMLMMYLVTGIALNHKSGRLFAVLSRLHSNPSGLFTIFSDIFAVATVLVILTGIFMMKGKQGIIGIGGIELIAGIAITLLFVIL